MSGRSSQVRPSGDGSPYAPSRAVREPHLATLARGWLTARPASRARHADGRWPSDIHGLRNVAGAPPTAASGRRQEELGGPSADADASTRPGVDPLVVEYFWISDSTSRPVVALSISMVCTRLLVTCL